MKQAAKDSEEIVPDYTVIAGLKNTNLADIANQINAKNLEMKTLKAEVDDLKAAGLKLVIKAHVKSVMVEGLRVTKIDGTSVKLNKKKLAAKYGTKVLAWLEYATDRTSYTSLKVTAPKEAEDDGAEEE